MLYFSNLILNIHFRYHITKAAYALKVLIMIIMTHNLVVRPKKRRELLQPIFDLIIPTRKMNGCLSHNCYQSIEDENNVILISEWNTQADVDYYIRSEGFEVLQGVRTFLAGPQEVKFSMVSYTSGMEFLKSSSF